METSPFSFTKCKFNNQTSPLLSIPQVFDDGVSPLATSFEKSRTVASSFPSYLAENELDGILREMNSSDYVGTPHFPVSPSSNRTRTSILKLEKSFDASVSSVITNRFETAETKLNKWFSGDLPNDVSSIPAIENLDLAPSEQMNNWGPVAEYVNSDSTNSIDQRNSSIRSSNSANSIELLNNSVSQPVTENSGSHYINSNSAGRYSDSKNSMESSDNFSPKPITENSSMNCTNSIEPTCNSLQSRNQFSDPSHPSQLPIDLSSMQDQENAIDFQNPNETNFKISIDLSSMLDQENYVDFQYPNIISELPIDLSSMQDQDNYAEFKNLDEMNVKLPIDRSSIQYQENKTSLQSPSESSSNLASKEITNIIEVDGEPSSTELKTISTSTSSVAEIPSTVKLQRVSFPVSGVNKISDSSSICDSKLEQKKPSAGEPELPPPNTDAVVPPSEAPKPTVQFVEPAVVREFAVPRNSSKIPATITVKGKSYKVLNILGSGGSSVVFQVKRVNFLNNILMRFEVR